MEPEGIPLAHLVFQVGAHRHVHIGADDEVHTHPHGDDLDVELTVKQLLVVQVNPVAFLLQHLLVAGHQLIHTGFGLQASLGIEGLVKGGAHVLGLQILLDLVHRIGHAVHHHTRQSALDVVDLGLEVLPFAVPLGLQLFQLGSQSVDLADGLTDFGAGVGAGDSLGQGSPLFLAVLVPHGVDLGTHRHIGVVHDIHRHVDIQILQNRDEDIPFPAILDAHVKIQSHFLLQVGAELDVDGGHLVIGHLFLKSQIHTDLHGNTHAVFKFLAVDELGAYLGCTGEFGAAAGGAHSQGLGGIGHGLELLLGEAGIQHPLADFLSLQGREQHPVGSLLRKAAFLGLANDILQHLLLIDLVQQLLAVHLLGNEHGHKGFHFVPGDDLVGNGVFVHRGDLAVHRRGVFGQVFKVFGVKYQEIVDGKSRCLRHAQHAAGIGVVGVFVHGAAFRGQLLHLVGDGVRHGQNLVGVLLVEALKLIDAVFPAGDADIGQGIILVCILGVVPVLGVDVFVDTDHIPRLQAALGHGEAAGDGLGAALVAEQRRFQHIQSFTVHGVGHILGVLDEDEVGVVLQVVHFILMNDEVGGAQHLVLAGKVEPASQSELIGCAGDKTRRGIDCEAAAAVGGDSQFHRLGAVLGQQSDVGLYLLGAGKIADEFKGEVRLLVLQSEGIDVQLALGVHLFIYRRQGHVGSDGFLVLVVGGAVLLDPLHKEIAVFGGADKLSPVGIAVAGLHGVDLAAPVGVKDDGVQHRDKGIQIPHQVLLHHIHVYLIHSAVGVDVGFGKVQSILCPFLAGHVPLHQIDVQQLYPAVAVGVAVQHGPSCHFRRQRRQSLEGDHGQQQAAGEQQAHDSFLHRISSSSAFADHSLMNCETSVILVDSSRIPYLDTKKANLATL